MSEIEIINEAPITLIETKELLEKIEKRDNELSEKGLRSREYINKMTKKSGKDVKELKNKLDKLGISRLKLKYITKILDLNPKEMDGLKILFASEPVTIKQEELQKVLECIK